MSEESASDYRGLTTKLVSAFLSHNEVPREQLGELIQTVYTTLVGLTTVAPVEPATERVPAVSPRRSIKPDAITCLVCGREMKMLKRHLAADHGMTVEEYRAAFNLAADYPVVAPNYANRRSELAKANGLGKVRVGSKRD